MEQPTQQRCDELGKELASKVKGQVLSDPISRALYSTDASIYQILPSLVLLPEDAQDVSAAVVFAGANGLTVGPRGAATGLAGESLNGGIIIDFTVHMTRILSINPKRSSAVVEAGCVFQVLNDALAQTGKMFGPDPASGNRATIGGMMGNNSTGAHSIRYGHTGDHVRWVEAVLSDGAICRMHADGKIEGGSSPLVEQLRSKVPAMLREWDGRIKANWPATKRNRAGYAVDDAVRDGAVNWPRLLCGSEGSLAIFTQAELALVDAPKVKLLVQANFDSIDAMARALVDVVNAGASTCELMDARLLKMAREAYPASVDLLPDAEASLLIELDAPDKRQLRDKTIAMQAALRKRDGRIGEPVVIDDAAKMADVVAMRKKAVPLLNRGRDHAKPISAIEDVAVPVENMPAYMEALRKIAEEEGVYYAYYAHAGDGELHVSPYLNLYDPADRKRLQRIAVKAYDVAWNLGGSISGEHGCGLVRSGWLHKQFGEVYQLFRQVKAVFDPKGLLNPDRIVTDVPGEELMVSSLRHDYALGSPRDVQLHFTDNEYLAELEACNGCGVCRSAEKGARMCPVFQATRMEAASCRGKANLLRHFVSNYIDGGLFDADAFRAVADKCVGCQMCVIECPSNVNVAKLMADTKARFVRNKGLRTVEQVLTRGATMGRMGSLFGPVANTSLKVPGMRLMMEKAMHVDRRRPMPPFAFRSGLGKFRKRAAQRKPANPIDRVVYFADMFANFHDHSLGLAVIDVLTHNGVEVIVPPQKDAAMPKIAYGDMEAARKVIRANVQRLLPYVQQGMKVICSEPSAALCLKREWREIEHTEQTAQLAQATFELTDYLLELHKAGKLKTDFKETHTKFAYHAPCHLRVMHSRCGSELVRLIPGASVQDLTLSCCGIAGTYGFKKATFELSLEMGKPMLDALKASDAQVGISECSTCRMQMKFGAGKETTHPIKVLAAAYGGKA